MSSGNSGTMAPENRMQKDHANTLALSLLNLMILTCAPRLAPAQDKNNLYPAMAPVSAYLMPESAEIALARSAAPKSISDDAEVMVLRQDGYTTAATGTNGFLCIVERSWGAATTESFFWNPKIRAP